MPEQELSDNPNLIVYRASAGSGKTHRLTGEYLRLLFSSPRAYRHILAVTFTNKATDEMKTRIIRELAKLASGQNSDYLAELVLYYSQPEEKIREISRQTLVNILHDYSAFSISTIDRFFQQTMRAFTREIGLGGGYNVELDTNKVLREAIDNLLYDLERTSDKQLLEWLIRFSEEKIESGETWNIRTDIHSLSDEIFKETYKIYSDQVQQDIADKEFLSAYKQLLLTIIRQYEKRSREIGEKALNILDRHGLKCEDFKGGSRSPVTAFRNWAKGEIKAPNYSFTNLSETVENCYTAKTSQDIKSKIEKVFFDGLQECVADAIEHYTNILFYQTAYEINRYFFTLGILSDVDRKIREYTAENNIMLISDTTELLNKIIQGTDPPFIYEKTGNYIDHYMVDEFQDTSGMQWGNFQSLVRESLASGKRSLIVGDVKQSIYRWRNSDWKLLQEQLEIDFGTENIRHHNLDTNWRSCRNIVDFNNAVFTSCASILQEEFNKTLTDIRDERIQSFSSKIKNAYSGVYQQTCPSKQNDEGHIKIEFIDTEENPGWQAYSLEKLPVVIEELQEKGYCLKDIAILVRTKKEGAEVANRILEYKGLHPESKYRYDIISDEALFIRNSKSIKLIISLLKYLRSPLDKSLESIAVYEYFKFSNQLSAEEALQKHFATCREFPEEIISRLNKIRELPLYEMTESLTSMFHDAMEKNENVYIQSFLDMVMDFTIRYSSDLDAFLEWWEESGEKKTVFTPDDQDAIRIMTIHKSKGLGFNVVLIPFCNWDIDHKLTTILWCKPGYEPFNQLSLVPVKYSQKLKNTIFEYEYFNEKLHAYIDNLNILYVAFTRAKKELIAFTPKPTREIVSNISSLLWACMHHETPPCDGKSSFLCLHEKLNFESCIFELGENYTCNLQTEPVSTKEIKIESLLSIPYDKRLKLRLDNKYYFSEDGRREYGKLMHEIISKINCIDDIENAVKDYYISGDLTQSEIEDLQEILYNFITDEKISGWYSKEYKVLNEVEILQPTGTFIRPDRVMIKGEEVIIIDYKFGEKEDSGYIKQIKYYASQIYKMQYKKVKGYICYVTLGKIVEV